MSQNQLETATNGLALSHDPGATLLYASRYTLPMLHAKQKQLIEIMSKTIKIGSISRDYDPYNDSPLSAFLRIDGLELVRNDYHLIEELSILNQTIASYGNEPQLMGRGLDAILDDRKGTFDEILRRVSSFEKGSLESSLGAITAGLYASGEFSGIKAIMDLGIINRTTKEKMGGILETTL